MRDKNQTIGFLLIMLLLFGYWYYMKTTYEKQIQQTQQQTIDTLQTAQINPIQTQSETQFTQDTTLPDSILIKKLIEKYSNFGKQAIGEEKIYTLKNDKIEIKISNKGAKVYSALVYGYKTHNGDPLYLFKGEKNKFNILFSANLRPIPTENFYFKALTNDTLIDASKQTQSITFRLYYDDNKWIDYIYSLEPNSYLLKFDIYFHNMDRVIAPGTTFLDLHWKTYMPSLERGDKWELQNMTIFYKFYQSDVQQLNSRKDYVEEEVPTKLRWVAFKHQFFSSVLIAYDYFDEAKLIMQVSEDPEYLKVMDAQIEVPFYPLEQDSVKMAFYFGPNKYSILKNIKLKADDKLLLERMIPLGKGLIRWINTLLIIPMFNFFGKFISNFGIVILLMTIVIKLLLSPLTYRSYLSSAKMRALKPEIDKILSKIPEEKQLERQQAMMQLYQKAGVNPMGGCLPVLLQLPILIAMFRFFPASIELRQQKFLWVDDLSTYDAILQWNFNIPLIGDHISLFALLMAIAMYITTVLNATPTDDSNPTAKSMKFMAYLMPILLFLWFNNYSAALSYYYFLTNLISIGQIYLMKAFISEEKLLEQLRENIKKNKNKKSKWQKRLEELQRQQQQLQRQKYRRR